MHAYGGPLSGSPLLVALSNLPAFGSESWSMVRPSCCRRAAFFAVMSSCSSACDSDYTENFPLLDSGCCMGGELVF